ncbi:MAG: peptide deformylase, partial [Acidobacteriota bacterium]|nr:peptide deformylase [Acidobacteriota bacterium]
APQIGIAKKITVIDCSGGEGEPQRIVLINPKVIYKEGKQTGEEGCLSIPGFREPVTRAKNATVRARDAKGGEFEMRGEDLLARAFQHEIDHLHGILFIAHVSALKRDLIKRRIKKLIKAGEWP